MNFLAHIYLSGDNDFIKIGNFMADGIRGTNYSYYPADIQKGILLHRAIDTFTDAHPVFRKSKHRLHQNYGHYSGVITDILYDHFLAKNWTSYSNTPLDSYVQSFYTILKENYTLLNEKTQQMLPYMIGRNWLVNYATIEGLTTTLFQMDHRTKNRVHMQNAIVELQRYQLEFEEEFTLFFKELQLFCQDKLKHL